LAQCGYRVVGADASEEMLEIARQRTGVPLAKKQTPLPSPLSKGGNRAGDPADTNTSLPSPLGKEGNCAGDSADTNARLPSALSKSGNREGDGGAGMTTPVEFVHSAYATLFEKVGGGFDGVYCIGNSLAASGTREDARGGLEQFAKCLRTGGRLFVQILNFPIMRLDRPCVRGPRITKVEGTEYVSVRHFVFRDDHVEVNNITLFQDDGWRYRAHTGRLYPITIAELGEWCGACELRIDETWGSYGREPFDPGVSVDLIIAATRA
jgi:SAM-dependent methyltransferase